MNEVKIIDESDKHGNMSDIALKVFSADKFFEANQVQRRVISNSKSDKILVGEKIIHGYLVYFCTNESVSQTLDLTLNFKTKGFTFLHPKDIIPDTDYNLKIGPKTQLLFLARSIFYDEIKYSVTTYINWAKTFDSF